jgi:DNA-binding transcriptional regulator YhcF (GntR family)
MEKKSSQGPLVPSFTFDRSSRTPVYRQVFGGLRRAIVEGRMRPGQRLPSTRSLARELGVSRMPVLMAFEQFYAGLFVCIDTAYNLFEREVLVRTETPHISERTKRMARRRSLVVLAMFATAMVTALVAPRLGFAMICAALLLHLRPDITARRGC